MTLTAVFDYELPAGTTVDSYPKWTSSVSENNSSTLNANKRIGTATMVVKWGGEISLAMPFPVDATISSPREDISTTNPAPPAGYTWKDPKFIVDTATGTSLTIEDQKTTKVDLLNTAGVADNDFQVVKKAGGAEDAATKKLSFSHTCTLPDNTKKNGQITDVPGDETPVVSPEKFPVGATCEVTEDTVGVGIDGYTLGPAGHDVQPMTIGMGSEPTVIVTFTSTYICDMNHFLVAKTVTGDADDKALDIYTSDYTCKADGKNPITDIITVGRGESKKSGEVPVGYSCTVREHVDQGQDGTAYLEGYTLDVVASPDITIARGMTPNIDVTSTYTLNKGTSSVKKVVQGITLVGADNIFTIQYTCTHNSVAFTDEQKAGSPTLTGNGMAATSPFLPFGTSCTVKETDGSVQHVGCVAATTCVVGQVTVETVTPSPEITVTNTYTLSEGRSDISETVDGDGAVLARDKEFTFDYTCTPPTGAVQVKGTVITKGGEIGAVINVPVGPCSVSERDVMIDGASFSMVFTVDGSTNSVNNGTAVLDVRDGTTVKVVVTNTYMLDRGFFSVAKMVAGGIGSFTHDTFAFDYVCMDGTKGRLDAPGDGTAVEGPRVPTGTECALTERVQTANHGGRTIVSELFGSGKVTATDEGMVVVVTATNTYTSVPTPAPSGETLAKVGAPNMLMLGVIGSALMLASSVLVVIKCQRDQV